eukprot:g34505.t1
MLNIMFCHVLDVSVDVPLRNFKFPEGGWQTLKSFTVPNRWLQIFAVITACWQMKMEELTANGMKADGVGFLCWNAGSFEDLRRGSESNFTKMVEKAGQMGLYNAKETRTEALARAKTSDSASIFSSEAEVTATGEVAKRTKEGKKKRKKTGEGDSEQDDDSEYQPGDDEETPGASAKKKKKSKQDKPPVPSRRKSKKQKTKQNVDTPEEDATAEEEEVEEDEQQAEGADEEQPEEKEAEGAQEEEPAAEEENEEEEEEEELPKKKKKKTINQHLVEKKEGNENPKETPSGKETQKVPDADCSGSSIGCGAVSTAGTGGISSSGSRFSSWCEQGPKEVHGFCPQPSECGLNAACVSSEAWRRAPSQQNRNFQSAQLKNETWVVFKKVYRFRSEAARILKVTTAHKISSLPSSLIEVSRGLNI